MVEILLDNEASARYRAWMTKAPEDEESREQKAPVNSPLHWAAFKVRTRVILAAAVCPFAPRDDHT